MGAITKVVYYTFAIAIAIQASKIGTKINQCSLDALNQLEQNVATNNSIAQNLNDTVIDSKDSVSEISLQIDNIKNSSAEMNHALLDTTAGISNVNKSITTAQSYISKNEGITDELTDKYHQVVSIINTGNENISNTIKTILIFKK